MNDIPEWEKLRLILIEMTYVHPEKAAFISKVKGAIKDFAEPPPGVHTRIHHVPDKHVHEVFEEAHRALPKKLQTRFTNPFKNPKDPWSDYVI